MAPTTTPVTTASGNVTTRDRILQVTATLIAIRGFHGTSTRDIAEAVGIRQPSLFHHFKSKQAILSELLDMNLSPALARVSIYGVLPGSPSVRIYAYLLDDLRDLITLPFDSRGLYVQEIFDDPDFQHHARMWMDLRDRFKSMVREAVRTGEFRQIEPAAVERIFFGMVIAGVSQRDGGEGYDFEGWPDAAVSFMMRGLVVEGTDVEKIRVAAETMIAHVAERDAAMQS